MKKKDYVVLIRTDFNGDVEEAFHIRKCKSSKEARMKAASILYPREDNAVATNEQLTESFGVYIEAHPVAELPETPIR